MGQVFTWDEVANRRMPHMKDFPEVVEHVRQSVQTEDSVVGALVCGSVIRGDHTVRSDIDCFVLYDHKREFEAFEWMQEMTIVAKSRHVPLCCIPCDTLLASTRMHHIGRSFYRHLETSAKAGGLLKGHPLRQIAPSLPEEEELESYLRVKMYNLQEAWGLARTFSEERTASYLKKLLEAPMHVARKTLALQAVLERDSKAYIQSQYRELMPQAMADGLDALVALDTDYTEQLLEHRKSPRQASYRRLLGSVMDVSEQVLYFIRSNLAFVAVKAR